MSFAKRLREARIAKGMPQFEAAHRLEVALRTYIRWENEEIEPRVSEFVAWCRVVEEDPATVIATVDPEPAAAAS